jgi:DNA-binding response OmpR family regulator
MQKNIFILFLLFIVQLHFAQTETPQVKESGIDEVFVKPFKVQELSAKINKIVRKIES